MVQEEEGTICDQGRPDSLQIDQACFESGQRGQIKRVGHAMVPKQGKALIYRWPKAGVEGIFQPSLWNYQIEKTYPTITGLSRTLYRWKKLKYVFCPFVIP